MHKQWQCCEGKLHVMTDISTETKQAKLMVTRRCLKLGPVNFKEQIKNFHLSSLFIYSLIHTIWMLCYFFYLGAIPVRFLG